MPKVVKSNLSPLKQHLEKWRGCTLCNLCETRKNVVLCKGQIPCDVLFVGEAPGASEDSRGLPFVGPAGHLLDTIINRAFGDVQVRIGYTNVVSCIPKTEAGSGKYGEPSKESIEACRGRLDEFISLCKPKAIVAVGLLAKKYLSSAADFSEFVDIIHPAAILKADITKQELMARRAVATLEELATRLGL